MTFRAISTAATALAVAIGGAALGVGPSAAAPADYTCPGSGAACLYADHNFHDDYKIYYPNTGYFPTSVLVGVRNRSTTYWLCIENTHGDKQHVAPHGGQIEDVGSGYRVSTLYFHGSSAC